MNLKECLKRLISGPVLLGTLLIMCAAVADAGLIYADDGSQVIYVAKDGDDENDGSSEETPVATLSKALELVPDSGEIVIGEGTYAETDYHITKSVKISGREGEDVVLDAGDQGRLFYSDQVEKIELKNLTLKNASWQSESSHGAAIDSQSNELILNYVAITDSSSTGCVIKSSGSLSIEQSAFTDNDARAGVIWGDKNAVITISDSSFEGNKNTASNGNGTVVRAYGPSLTITGSSFIGNQSRTLGGAVFLDSQTEGSITGSVFINNKTADGKGDVVYVRSQSGESTEKTLTINYSMIIPAADSGHSAVYINTTSYTGSQKNNFSADNNWWGSNDPTRLVSFSNSESFCPDKWSVLNAEPSSDLDKLMLGDRIQISVDNIHVYTHSGEVEELVGGEIPFPEDSEYLFRTASGSLDESIKAGFGNSGVVNYTVDGKDDEIIISYAYNEIHVPLTIITKDLTHEDIEITIEDQLYTGNAISPDIVVRDKGRNYKLIRDTDYTVSFSDNVEVGTATATITAKDGNGCYQGEVTKTFEIIKAATAAEKAVNEISALPDVEDITLKNKAAVETARAMYDALTDEEKNSFPSDVYDRLESAEAKIAQLEKEAADQAEAEKVKNLFTALPAPADLTIENKAAVEAARAAYDALTDDQKAKITKEELKILTDAEAKIKVLEENTETQPEPEPQTVPNPVSINDEKVILSRASFTYNGKVQKPSITKIGGKELKEETDYTVIWSNAKSKNAGSYTLTVTGKGNYTGSSKAVYKINKASNKLKVKGKTAKIEYSRLRKKKQALAVKKLVTVTKKGQGKLTYTKKAGNKKITVNKKTGKTTVEKGLKKGTYKVKVKIKAAGNKNFKPSAAKTVTFVIKVK